MQSRETTSDDCTLLPMVTRATEWEARFDRILLGLLWGSTVLGASLVTIARGPTPPVLAAMAATGAYAAALHAGLRSSSPRTAWIFALSGVAVGGFAAWSTGGSESPFVLFLAAPVYYASVRYGTVLGASTTGAAIVALTVGDILLGRSLPSAQLLQASLFYALVAVTFSQARRILIDEQLRAERLARTTLLDAQRLERLEASHDLLLSLGELATASELNPVGVGRAALRDLAQHVDFVGAEVRISQPAEVVVARRGEPGSPTDARRYPISIASRRLGELRIWPPAGVDRSDRSDDVIETMLRPIALAFDNIVLLSGIAARAVREERLRLARELHDEIGPAVASLGLGIDLLAMDADGDDATTAQLAALRETATRVVESIRATVEDLRAVRSSSLVECVHAIVGEIDADGPAVIVELDEQRPPRDGIAEELAAILTEAVRNAVEHSGASKITIAGSVDRDRGHLSVSDDGRGFDPGARTPGHWGIIGMRERADKIGGRLTIASGQAGTTVELQWGTR